MSEQQWTAEETREGWAIRYNPTPGGVKQDNGTTAYSLSFIAMTISEMVVDAESAAKSIARELNAYPPILAALKAFPGFTDECAVGDPWIEQKNAALDLAEGRS